MLFFQAREYLFCIPLIHAELLHLFLRDRNSWDSTFAQLILDECRSSFAWIVRNL